MIYRKFSKRQMLAMTWWNRPELKDRDAIICDGAIRSGKTVCMAVGFFLWSMACFQDQCFAICGRSVGAVRRNILIHLQTWLGDAVQLREFPSRNLVVAWTPEGHCNSYYVFGGDSEGAYKRIQGMTLAGILMDEAAICSRSFVEQACARCSAEGSKLWFNCNPAGPEHWFYREWICRAREKNALHLHFTMADNPGLSSRIRQRYERMYTGVFYRRYILGQWCLAEGLVYGFDPEKHIARVLPQTGRYYISVDYGIQNPFSAGLWCVAEGRAVRLREFYHSGRLSGATCTDEEYYDQLEKLAGDLPVEKVIVDPSAASFIATVRRHGRFRVRKARNQVLGGIQLVERLLQEGKLQFAPQCRDTIREFGLYCWEESSVQDKPRKENDHAMDEIRYFCATVLSRGE